MLDETLPDGTLRHTVPVHWAVRVVLACAGGFVLFIIVHELGRPLWAQGLWPPNIFTLFFAIIFFGGLSIGSGILSMALFGTALYWTITPGKVAIRAVNPFRTVDHRFTRGQIVGFTTVEHDNSEGPNTFSVRLTTIGGQHYDSRSFGSRAAADRLLTEFTAAFSA
ncbi:MAG: hypothetical protein ABL879_08305 [Devosia sp.]